MNEILYASLPQSDIDQKIQLPRDFLNLAITDPSARFTRSHYVASIDPNYTQMGKISRTDMYRYMYSFDYCVNTTASHILVDRVWNIDGSTVEAEGLEKNYNVAGRLLFLYNAKMCTRDVNFIYHAPKDQPYGHCENAVSLEDCLEEMTDCAFHGYPDNVYLKILNYFYQPDTEEKEKDLLVHCNRGNIEDFTRGYFEAKENLIYNCKKQLIRNLHKSICSPTLADYYDDVWDK